MNDQAHMETHNKPDAEFDRDAKPGERFTLDDLAEMTFRFFGLAEPCDIKRDDAENKNLEEGK